MKKVGPDQKEEVVDVDILHGVRMYRFFNGKVDAEVEGPGFQIRPGTGKNSLSYGVDFRSSVAGK